MTNTEFCRKALRYFVTRAKAEWHREQRSKTSCDDGARPWIGEYNQISQAHHRLFRSLSAQAGNYKRTLMRHARAELEKATDQP